MGENEDKEKISNKEEVRNKKDGSKENTDLRKASPLVIKVIVIGAFFLIAILVTMHFWAKPTTGTDAQKRVQTEAATIYSAAQANANAGTLVTNNQIVTTEEFPELPVTIAVNALFQAGQIQSQSDASVLTGGGVDPTMSQLQTIINTPAYKLQVNSLGDLTAIPDSSN